MSYDYQHVNICLILYFQNKANCWQEVARLWRKLLYLKIETKTVVEHLNEIWFLCYITINHVSNDSLSPIEVLSSEACFRHLKKKFISIHAKIRQKLRRRDTWTFLHHSVKCYKTIYETHDNDCVNTRKIYHHSP